MTRSIATNLKIRDLKVGDKLMDYTGHELKVTDISDNHGSAKLSGPNGYTETITQKELDCYAGKVL